MKILHPKEAITQIGLIHQQIKFSSVLKVKNQMVDNENVLLNVVQDLIQK